MELHFITPNDTQWFDLDDLPNEDWKDVEGYEGLYQVSNYGRIKGLTRKVILKPLKSKYSNYRYTVSLSKDNVVKQAKCHRLVATAFVPNQNNLPEVNHRNPVTEKICDNRSSNLEWVTHSENMRWRVLCNNHPKNTFIKNGESINNKTVVMLDLSGNYLQTFPSLRIASRATGIDETGISKVCHNRLKQTGCRKFMFKEDYELWLINGKH